jgi:hypothetical protein
MLDEVVVHMLRHTRVFKLKYHHNSSFKIAEWFRAFLHALPGTDGLNAIKELNFPHMHWFNHNVDRPVYPNPDMRLMTACRRLRKVSMTFHVSGVTIGGGVLMTRAPRPVNEIVEFWGLKDVLLCSELREVYIDGIYEAPWEFGESQHLDSLVELGKFFMLGFRRRYGAERTLRVEVARRWGKWEGDVVGDVVELTDDDLENEEREIRALRGLFLGRRDFCARTKLL